MAKKNDDFFQRKKPWSEVKDELFACYFKPYLTKIIHTRRPVVYVDCFAGKGKFDDGNPGSPLIALDIIHDCLSSTTMNRPLISTTFIDLNYAEDLRNNLKEFESVEVISGKFEENINEILKDKHGCNVFLYIDPYGIKSLQSSMFDSFANGKFNTIELLINMNSFGFIREACNAFGVTLKLGDPKAFEDLIEYDPANMTASKKSIQDLNEIAGGDYWQEIIEDYKEKRIDGYQAEEEFAKAYCCRLMNSYKYVLNMPLRIRRGQRPKYRMIHATNHPEGCLLMVDNICNRWETWKEIQNNGQTSLFQEDPDNQIINVADVESKTVDFFSQFNEWTSLNVALASFFVKHGPICKTKVVRDFLKNLENNRFIQVSRTPSYTKTGRPSKFMEENSKQKVRVKWFE